MAFTSSKLKNIKIINKINFCKMMFLMMMW